MRFFLAILVMGAAFVVTRMSMQLPLLPFAKQPETRLATDPLVPVFDRAPVFERTHNDKLDNRPAAHYIDEFRCRGSAFDKIEKSRQRQVYQWRDAKGKLHFGDKKPKQASGVAVTAKYLNTGKQYFNLSLHEDQGGLPPFFKDQLLGKITKAYDVLASFLPVADLRQVHVNLWIFNSPKAYQQFVLLKAPSLADSPSLGFHRYQGNIAAAWRVSDEQLLATSVHEAVHVMNVGIFGFTPRWLNEGLAEYLETIEVSGQSATITISPHVIRKIIAQRLPIATVFRGDHSIWQGPYRSQLYQQSRGLISFLLDTSHTKKLLAQYLMSSLAQPCKVLDAFEFFTQHYPGGLSAMEVDFGNWLTRPQQAHYY